MKKNLLILAYEAEIFNEIAAAKILQDKYNITFFCCDWFTALSEDNKKLIQNSSVKYDYIFDIKNEILKLNKLRENQHININYKYIKSIEDLYLNEKIFHIHTKDFALNEIDSPRLHYYYPRNKYILDKYLELILKKFEKVIKFKKYDIIYSAGTSNLIRNIFLSYCRKKRVPYYAERTRFSMTYLAECSSNVSNIKYLIKNKFKSKKFFFDYSQSNKIFNYSKLFNKHRLFLGIKSKFKIFKNLTNHYKARIQITRPNYFHEKNTFLIFFFEIRTLINKYLIQNYILMNISKKINIIKKEKFIYIPLHRIPEGGVFDQNEFINESYLVHEISKLIPADYKILVKPHPDLFQFNLSESIYPISWYKKIGKLSNVELLSHNINNDFILKHCKSTVSIAGTPSLECALLYNKISFVVGDVELTGVKNLLKYNRLIFKKFIDGKLFVNRKTKNKIKKLNNSVLNSLNTYNIKPEDNQYSLLNQRNKNKDIFVQSQDFAASFVWPGKLFSESQDYKKIMIKFLKRIL
jgi:hypothetical protein